MNTLLTAFCGENNSSKLLLDNIAHANKILLTNSFDKSSKQLIDAIDKTHPSQIISFGQKPNSNCLTIETVARKDDAIKTDFDIKEITEILEKNSVEYVLSGNAGNYLCNHIYYEGLNYIKENGLQTKMIFIHLPSVKQFANFNAVSECLKQLA